MKKLTKLLSLNKIWSKTRKQKYQGSKVFPISLSVLGLKKSRLSVAWKKVLILSTGKISGLRNRLVITQQFIDLLLRTKKNHGADFTIKWLKACYVALQKAQANDNLPSLRTLEPSLPMPRLINGLPAFIKSGDRKLIKAGNVSVIRFWSSLFSIYRIMKCSYRLKIGSIIDPFTGDNQGLNQLMDTAHKLNLFAVLPGFANWRNQLSLAPQRFLWGQKASPTCSVAWHGLLSELYFLIPRGSSPHPIVTLIDSYLSVVRLNGEKTDLFNQRILDGWQIIENIFGCLTTVYSIEKARYILDNMFPRKDSWTGNSFGQLSLKEEAAGKLRVFAMVDNLTQSVLRPLHLALQDLLRLIPNDGTFDQDESVQRSAKKASSSGCAFSFDLSAATDRLPVALSSTILSSILSLPIGDPWMRLLIDREYSFNEKTQAKYGCPDSVRYSVGQPMGALSSWVMLAVTHHWILQLCSLRLRKSGQNRSEWLVSCDSGLIPMEWEQNYEILGDDLTIFDRDLADMYLRVCKILGVEINLSKSISSVNKPVFEFAKRTYNNGVDVSPVPFKPLIHPSLADIVGNYLLFSKKGLIKTSGILLRFLTRFGSINQNDLLHPILAILGAYTSMKLVPHRWLVESLVDPKDEEFDFDSSPLRIPLVSSIKLIMDISRGMPNEQYPFSHQEIRSEFYDDYEDEFANVISNEALMLARKLEVDYDDIITSASEQVCPLTLCENGSALLIRTEGIWGSVQGWVEENFLSWDKGLDPVELVDEIETDPKFYYRRGLTLDHAQKMLEKVERLDQHFRVNKVSTIQTGFEAAKAVVSLTRVVQGKSPKYWSIARPAYRD